MSDGKLFLSYSHELRIGAGIIIIIFSLHILGFLNLKFLNYEKRLQVLNVIHPIVIKKLKEKKKSKNKKYLNDALMTSIAGISAAMKNTG